MKRKIGDKVRVIADLVTGTDYGGVDFSDDMVEYLGCEVEINYVDEVGEYMVNENVYWWSEEMLEDIEVDPSAIFESLLKMQEQKDKKYGNSALKPLNVFAKYHNYGSRIDEKLARVKNSEELRKNDVADIMGGIALLYKDFSGLETFREVYDSIQKNEYIFYAIALKHRTGWLNIFKGKDPLGGKIDQSILSIKEVDNKDISHMLSALFNELILLCKNKGWTNFDDQID